MQGPAAKFPFSDSGSHLGLAHAEMALIALIPVTFPDFPIPWDALRKPLQELFLREPVDLHILLRVVWRENVGLIRAGRRRCGLLIRLINLSLLLQGVNEVLF